MGYTTADLLESVKLQCFTPTSQTDISDADILRIATEEQLGIAVPLIVGLRCNYFETVKDYALTGSNYTFTIPARAIGGKIATLTLVGQNDTEIPCPLVDYGEMASLRPGTVYSNYGSVVAYIRNNKVVLNPVPQGYTQLRMVYYARPGDLVATSSARQITAVGGSSVTLSSALTGLSTGVRFDIVANDPVFPFVGIDQTATVAGSTLTFAPPTDTAVNDWVALAGTSPIAQIPYECHSVLYHRVVARVLEIIGDRVGMAAAKDTANDMMAQVSKLLAPRVDKQVHKVMDETGLRPFSGRWFPWS